MPAATAGPTHREETRIGYNAITRPKMEYPLPMTCFTKEQCYNFQGRFCLMTLSKMGINRNMPKAVISGPPWYGGLDIRELWMTQGGGHNKFTVSFLRKEDIIRAMLCAEMAALQATPGWSVLASTMQRWKASLPVCTEMPCNTHVGNQRQV